MVCPVIIKMPRRKASGIQWCSHPFYTQSGGYKLCICVKAGGEGEDGGKGNHLSVQLYLMKGSHDDKLTWPLSANVMVTLVNQISDNEHHSFVMRLTDIDGIGGRVVNGELAARGWGMNTFVSNEKLYKSTPICQFFKDDRIFFQICMIRIQHGTVVPKLQASWSSSYITN